jgi:hypothetical protein
VNLSQYERGQRVAAGLLGNVIHESAQIEGFGSGNAQPVTDLYELLVQHGRREAVADPYRPGGGS